MNRLLFSALLILIATSIYAQESTLIELSTKDGRIVILKPDGTWEFKKITSQPSPTSTLNKVNLSITIDSLPINFTGENIETLFSNLRTLEKTMVKSEFETTVQYQKRISEEMQKPIINDSKLKDTFFLVISRIRADYDADTQKMQYLLPISESYPKDNYTIKGFGERYSIDIVFNDINNLIPKTKFYLGVFPIEVSLGMEEAKRLKATTKAVALVKLKKPYINIFDLNVNLIDFYLFDPQTGKILAKLSKVKE